MIFEGFGSVFALFALFDLFLGAVIAFTLFLFVRGRCKSGAVRLCFFVLILFFFPARASCDL